MTNHPTRAEGGAEDEIRIEFQDGWDHRRVRLVFGDMEYRAVVFRDGAIRLWGVKAVEPITPSSIIVQPFKSQAARKMAMEESA
jgi:hypothetical protein